MRKVKLLDSGPNKNYAKAQIIEVDDVRAAILIKAKHAEEVKDGDEGIQECQVLQRRV